MEDLDLKKLKRSELLEIMLAQSEEIDRLRAELEEKDRQLNKREIAISESGSIAEASLKLTKVFLEAQKAADLYLENVRRQAGIKPGAQAYARQSAGSAKAIRTQTPQPASNQNTQAAGIPVSQAVSQPEPAMPDLPAEFYGQNKTRE